jgi:GntR family transcriptional regulator
MPRVSYKARRREVPSLYQVVVQSLQKDIIQGIYPVGSQLPSEAQLVERFGVSRHTIREAIRVLREMRVVNSRQGYGTVVESLGREQGYVHHVNEISDLFPANVRSIYTASASPLAELPVWARVLPEIEPASRWLYVAGVRYYAGADRPFNEVDVFVAERFAGVGRAIGPDAGPLYESVEMLYAEPIGEVNQMISGFVANDSFGSRIGLKEGEAGLEVRRTFRLASDRSIALISFNRFGIDDYSFSMTLHRV